MNLLMKRILFAVVLLPIIVTSCMGPLYLQEQLNNQQYSLGYLHDAPKNNQKLDISISPIVYDKSSRSDTSLITTVSKDNGHLMFLVFMFNYDYNFNINLGKNSLKPRLEIFIRDAFIRESLRSGSYLINDTSAMDSYLLNIEILDYNVDSKYHKDGFAIGGYSQSSIDIKPSKGEIRLKATLFNSDNKSIFSKEYFAEKSANFVATRSLSQNEIHNNLMQNMSESLGQCIKSDISKIINDLNSFLDK